MRRSKNPALFRQMSEPFASIDEANEAIEAFFAAVSALRETHQFPNVVCVIHGCYLAGGEEVEFANHMTVGDELKAVPLLAHAYGYERALHEQRIALMEAQGKKGATR